MENDLSLHVLTIWSLGSYGSYSEEVEAAE